MEHDGVAADVDIAIAPLIRELWRAGLWTQLSCEDNDGRGGGGGYVWVQFVHASALEQFLRILFPVRDDEIESLYNRAIGGIEPDDWQAFNDERAWRYRAHPTDRNEAGHTTKAADIWLTADVWFPRTDLDDVIELMLRHNTDRPADSR